MTKAAETILILALVWGLPVYFIDRRARHNNKPTSTRVLIAVLMLFYYLVVPVFIALKLAGFDVHWPARQRWVDEARYRHHLEQQGDHDSWQEREREEEARRNEELDELQARREEEDEEHRRAEQEALDNAYWAEQEEQEQRHQQR